MGSINIDNTGSGADVSISSDGTNLLLDGTAVGGGGADLYAANESSPTAQPSATGANAIAIGDGATAGGDDAFAIGDGASATANFALALGRNSTASNFHTIAIGESSAASGNRAIGIGRSTGAAADYSTALGVNSSANGSKTATGQGAMALGGSYASGTDSFAAAIANNTSSYGATGANSIAMGWRATAGTIGAISIGYESIVSGNFATSIGRNNSVTGAVGTAIGGQQSTVSGAYAVVLGGLVNTASGDVSYAFGRRAKAEQNGKYAFGIEHTTTVGSEQAGMLVLAASTTDATAKALSSDSSAAGSANQIILPNNSAYAFHGTIVARQKAGDGTASAAWKVEGLIRREGSAGTTVLVNSATTVLDNTPSWGMALSADTTNGGLAITVTGAASTNIRWVATIHTSEVTYA